MSQPLFTGTAGHAGSLVTGTGWGAAFGVLAHFSTRGRSGQLQTEPRRGR